MGRVSRRRALPQFYSICCPVLKLAHMPRHAKKRKGALHETCPRSNRRLPWESGAEDARTPSASRLLGGSGPREASGVRPIYRRSFSMNRLIRSADSQLPPFNFPVSA